MTDNHDNQNPEGGLGGPLFGHDNGTARDTRLVERAIRKRWNIPEDYKTAVINRLVKIAIDPGVKEREAIQAGRAVIQAEGQNQSDEHAAAGKGQGVNVNVGVAVGVNVRESVREAMNEPDYVDYLRRKAMDEDRIARTVCTNGEPGPMADGASSDGDGRGNLRHHHGQNGTPPDCDIAPSPRKK